MAATPQQVKEWGRPAGPPQRDVGAALAALSEEDLLRLRAIARLRARRPMFDRRHRAGHSLRLPLPWTFSVGPI
jgi:hypothetical protein